MATSQIFKDYIVRYRKGDRVYSAGDPGTEMYIVQSGSVEVFREVAGTRVSLALMEKGDFFGEMALIESLPHATCAEAAQDCELLEINSTLFDKMIKGNIEIAVRMLRKLSIRLRDATTRLEEMAVATAMKPGEAAVVSARATAAAAPVAAAAPPASPPVAQVTEPGLVGRSAPADASSQPVPAATARPKGCHAVLSGEDGRELFHIVTNRAAIGRFDPVTGLKPEVDLSTLDLNRSVSRHHARLTAEDGVYNITEEVGALNGTFINGKKLVSGKPARIKNGDTLNLGMVKLLFSEVQNP